MKEWFLNLLKEAVDKGIVIVNVSQCMGGSVQMSRYGTGCKLEDVGVVSGYDSTTEAVLTKLMFLFGHRYSAKVVKDNRIKKKQQSSAIGFKKTVRIFWT